MRMWLKWALEDGEMARRMNRRKNRGRGVLKGAVENSGV